ncbi:MAG: hypothetical protein HUU38_03080 [Anaerolineales bacterium]|nr:hypothetical protein [Anaerolineales bacterium]
MFAVLRRRFQPPTGGRGFVLGGVIIGLFTLGVYHRLWWGDTAHLFPWGSDTSGHALKVEYLLQELAKGHLYPDLLPSWYMGLQMMRYHPPLPYYLLAGLAVMLGSSLRAANLFIVLCAWAGGASWMLFRRWIGWGPALIGGMLFVILPDNVRVALAEGNLPRVLATALLPFTFYCLLASLTPGGSRLSRVGLVLGFSAITLSHVMMAAIYAVCLSSWVLAAWVWRRAGFRDALLAILWIASGLALAGWWLLPSLTGGGITSLNTEAMTEALTVFPLQHYFSLGARAGNPEAIYVGPILILVAAGALIAGFKKEREASALALIGLLGILITVPGFNTLFKALPLQSLLWPLRFLGVASFMLLLSVIWRLQTWTAKWLWWVGGVLLLIGWDAWGSVYMIDLRPARPELLAMSGQLAQTSGWREATLDESRLGSAASYLFTAEGTREQVYGWAYQGARTASLVASLNETLLVGHEAYLLDRLNLLGVDDVVLLDSLASATLPAQLARVGYTPQDEGEATLYHRTGTPRAILASWQGLGIGASTRNVAYLFPQLVVGTSNAVDDYTLADLTRYPTLFLSAFTWHDQEKAEALLTQAAEAGTRVVVDLTGVQEDVLARIPQFLDVWGEYIILDQAPLTVNGADQPLQLSAFQMETDLWYTHIPQGLDAETLTFSYLGQTAALTGYKTVGDAKIWFIGANLPYHAALTRDSVAIQILADLLQLPPDTPTPYKTTPLTEYHADAGGYQFTYTLSTPETLLVPLAYHAGLHVTLDGAPIPTTSVETLLLFDAPAGTHTLEVSIRPTSIYLAGWVTSALALVFVLALWTKGERWLQSAFKGAEPVDAETFLAHLKSAR